MTIAPQFDIVEQNATHLIIHVHVPHIRFQVEEVQLILSNDGKVVQLYCPPIYLLKLNFTPHQFRNDDDDDDDDENENDDMDDMNQGNQNEEDNNDDAADNDNITHTENVANRTIATTTTATTTGATRRNRRNHATYIPHLHNGIIRLELEKLYPNQPNWEHLDLYGKFQQPSSTTSISSLVSSSLTSSTSTSKLKWLREIIQQDDDDNNNNQVQPPPLETTKPLKTTTMKTTTGRKKYVGTYGFHRMFSNIYTDLQRANAQMLECPNVMEERHNVPNGIQQPQRQQERIESYELKLFNIERYVQDMDLDHCNHNNNDEDHDQNDDDYLYNNAMQMIPHWRKETDTTENDHQNQSNSNPNHFFNASEQKLLMSIPYPLLDDTSILHPPLPQSSSSSSSNDYLYHHGNQQQQMALCIGLLDILFAYVYDHMTTIDAEPTVESSWTISIMSVSLSWLHDWLPPPNDDDSINNNNHDDNNDVNYCHINQNHDTVHSKPQTPSSSLLSSSSCMDDMVLSVIQSSIRRSLIYPYIRNFTFSICIWNQVLAIFQHTQSIRVILRCLLQVRNILDHSELHYLGNKLYIDPYLIWIQQYTDIEYFQQQLLVPIGHCLHHHIHGVSLNKEQLKDSLGLNLLQIEADLYNINNNDDSDGEIVSESDVDSSDEEEESDADSEDTDGNNPDEPHGAVEDVEAKVIADEVKVPDDSVDDDIGIATDALERLEILPVTDVAKSRSTGNSGIRRDDLFNICNQLDSLTTTDAKTVSSPLIQEVE